MWVVDWPLAVSELMSKIKLNSVIHVAKALRHLGCGFAFSFADISDVLTNGTNKQGCRELGTFRGQVLVRLRNGFRIVRFYFRNHFILTLKLFTITLLAF